MYLTLARLSKISRFINGGAKIVIVVVAHFFGERFQKPGLTRHRIEYYSTMVKLANSLRDNCKMKFFRWQIDSIRIVFSFFCIFPRFFTDYACNHRTMDPFRRKYKYFSSIAKRSRDLNIIIFIIISANLYI